MGTSSVAAVWHSSANVKVALRRSKPYEVTVPMVAIGLGRTYASAARKPDALRRSAGVFEVCEEIEGVERVFLRLVGETGDCVEERLCEKAGEALSTEIVEALVEFGIPWLEAELGERGRSSSSRETIDRSSPFQRSPHW